MIEREIRKAVVRHSQVSAHEPKSVYLGVLDWEGLKAEIDVQKRFTVNTADLTGTQRPVYMGSRFQVDYFHTNAPERIYSTTTYARDRGDAMAMNVFVVDAQRHVGVGI